MVSEEELAEAAEFIRNGGLVAFPTETVYGLGANALVPEAVEKIYRAKGRPASSPLIVHVRDIAMARDLASEWPDLAQQLAQQFWPGPLTVIVKKSSIVPDVVTAGLPSVGIRMPANQIAAELISRAGVPVAAPSANRFTEISPTTADHVRQSLGDFGGLILDGGPTSVGIESTVVSLTRVGPVLLRPGTVSQEELELRTGMRWPVEQAGNGPQESPGLHVRHYAPRTPLRLLRPNQSPPQGNGRVLVMPDDPAAFAATLYASLHEADREGWEWIAIRKPPAKPEWLAILDRLSRAGSDYSSP
jgi:L-threonylcarbamoyladenylate synthase